MGLRKAKERSMNYWLVVGSSKNWETAFNHGNIWGLRQTQHHLWNSHIFIVASDTEHNKVKSLLSGTFHEIRNRVKFIELGKVEELYNRKKAYVDFERELGI